MTKILRITAILLLASIMLFSVSACADKDIREITPEEVVAAYERAGYEVWQAEEYDDSINVEIYTVKATHENGEYIFFHFFDSAENAEAYAKDRRFDPILWLFTVLYGEPSWLTAKTYGNIEIEYDDNEHYKPFDELVK